MPQRQDDQDPGHEHQRQQSQEHPSPANRRGHQGGTRSASVPATTIPIRLASRKALNTHPYRRRFPRWRPTTGKMVAMASASNATKVTASTRPTVSRRRAGAHTPPAASADFAEVSASSVLT